MNHSGPPVRCDALFDIRMLRLSDAGFGTGGAGGIQFTKLSALEIDESLAKAIGATREHATRCGYGGGNTICCRTLAFSRQRPPLVGSNALLGQKIKEKENAII